MTATARSLPATPPSGASPGRWDAPETPSTSGAGLTVVEGPHWSKRLEHAATHRRVPTPSQLGGEVYLLAVVAEGLAWPVLDGDPFLFTLTNFAAFVGVVLTQLAHREHQKRSRIAARQMKGAPAWAGASTTTF